MIYLNNMHLYLNILEIFINIFLNIFIKYLDIRYLEIFRFRYLEISLNMKK